MIHVLNLTCARDWKLSRMMEESVMQFCPHRGAIITSVEADDWLLACPRGENRYVHLRENGFGQWGWPSTEIKIATLRWCSRIVRVDEYLVSVDSDVYFTARDIFDWVLSHKPAIAGHPHDIALPTHMGPFQHLSGACMFIRGDVLRSITTGINMQRVETLMRGENLCVQEDVGVSYIARYDGWNLAGIPNEVWNASLIHYNTPNKHDYPDRLKAEGNYPPWPH